MAYKLSLTEAKILVVAAQNTIKDNYADLLAIKLNSNSSYIAGCIRRLKLAGLVETAKSGKRAVILNINKETLATATLLIVKQQQQQDKKGIYPSPLPNLNEKKKALQLNET